MNHSEKMAELMSAIEETRKKYEEARRDYEMARKDLDRTESMTIIMLILFITATVAWATIGVGIVLQQL